MAITVEIVNAVYVYSGALNSSPVETVKSRADLTVFSAEVDVTVDEKLSGELHRCMKKKPPSQLKYSLIYVGRCTNRTLQCPLIGDAKTGKDEYDRSSEEQRNCHSEGESILQGLHADLEGCVMACITFENLRQQSLMCNRDQYTRIFIVRAHIMPPISIMDDLT